MPKFADSAKKVAQHTVGAVSWLGSTIKWSLIAVSCVALAFVAYVVWQTLTPIIQTITGKETPITVEEQKAKERRIVDDANLKCLSYAGADDGKDRDPQERLFLAITTLNLASEKGVRVEKEENGRKVVDVTIDACEVYESFGILMMPGQKTSQLRSTKWAWMFLTSSQINQTKKFVREYLENPEPFLKQWPWLPESSRALRMAWRGTATPTQDLEGMRKTMCRLWGQPGKTAEFFRYKKGPDDDCK